VEQATRIKSDLHFDIHRRLKEAGVTVAAPAAPAPPPTVVTFAGFEHLATPRLETAQDSERGYAPMRQSV
jgi:hypothetical protein